MFRMVGNGIKDSYAGEWRIASSARPSGGGILSIGREIRLRTARTLQGLAGDRAFDHDDFQDEVILGDAPAGKITMLHCWSGPSTTTASGISDVETRAGVILVGHRSLETEAERTFDQLSFRLTGLTSWMGRRPITSKRSSDSETVSFAQPTDVPFLVPDGHAVIHRSQSSTMGATVGSIESHEEVFIELNQPQPFDQIFDRYMRPLRYLFDLATDEPCEASFIRIANSTSVDEYGIPFMFSVRYPTDGPTVATRSIASEMPLTPGDIDPSRLIPQWFELESRLGPVCDLLFSLRDQSHFYISTMSFTVASAAESMHTRLYPEVDNNTAAHQARMSRIYATLGNGDDREWLEKALKWSAGLSYTQRLEALVAHAGVAFGPYLNLKVSKWIWRIASYRNIVAHSKDGLHDKPKDVVRLASTMDLLLRIILLRELGFTDQQCARMIDRSRRWKHLRAVLPKEVPRVCISQ